MKIVKLQAENIKKLQAVEITPSGEIVTIAGKNGAGKSSVLDSIWWALAGTSHIQAEPIRKGETKARIRLDMGEIVVERRFTAGASTLSVENAEGARFPSPQKMLDALLGELSFDPLAFSRLKPRDQFDELRRVAQLEIDIEQLDGLNRSDYAKRTEVNRDAKAKRAQADGITFPADTPEAPVDDSALVDELQRAGERNAEIETRKARRESVRRDIEELNVSVRADEVEAAQLRARADELDAHAKEMRAKIGELTARLNGAEPLPEPVDVAAIRARMEQAKVVNIHVAQRAQRTKLIAEAEALEQQSKELSERMDAREAEKSAAIAAAKMPVQGLGLGAGVVTFKGIPLEQCSSAEQLRISLAIAMAANPKIRVIRIQDGSLLDDDSLAAVAEMAKAQDYQVWIERVDTSGKVGIVIEDGMVKAAEPVAAEAAE